MSGHLKVGKHGFRKYLFALICVMMIFLAMGCGGGTPEQSSSPGGTDQGPSASGTASATFTVQWHDAVQLQDLEAVSIQAAVSREALDCQASGIADVVCNVYNDTGTLLVTGGPWPCTDGGARIDGIPVGQNRMFVVLAEDDQGELRYQGETPGITIDSGVTGVTIDAFSFVPDLLAPADGDPQVDPTNASLTWTSVANADQYLVEVAQDDSFTSLAIDQILTVSDPSNPDYMPADLQPAATYFWRISAVDINSNIGAASAVRSFSTSDCTSEISPTDQAVAVEGGTYDVTVTTSLNICTWSSSVPANAGWITLSPASGTGSGTVAVTVAANTGSSRSAIITIAGQSHTVNQTSETTAPTITITSPTSNPSYSTTLGALDIAGTASDNTSVTQVTWSNNQGGSGTCSGTTSWSASGIQLAPGQNVITVTATDPAGNTGTDTLTVNYTDATDPIVTITSPTRGTTYNTTNQSLDIAGDASDNVSVTQVTWSNNRGGNGQCSGTTSWSASGIPLVPGQNVITVTATDPAGNTSADTLTVNYTDATDPTVTITSPTSNASYSTTTGALDIAGTASDNVAVTEVTWANDQGGSGTCTGTTSWSASGIKLVVGDNIITVTAADAAGNTSTDTLTVNYRLLPDYIVTTLAPESDSILRGTPARVTYQAQNQGGAPLPQNCISMGIYLSTDATITTTDTLLQSWELADCNIAAGQGLSETRTITIPVNTPVGSYYLGIIIDVGQNETESNENNNTRATPTPITVYILG